MPSYEIAKANFALEQPEKAREWLNSAFEQRSHSLVFLRVDPQLSALQKNTAFVRLADRVQPASTP